DHLEPAALAVLPGDPEHVEVASGAGGHAGAGVELDRVAPVDGQREGPAHAGVLLQVLALLAVDRRAAALVEGAVQCAPDTAAEPVDEMSLHRDDRILVPRPAQKI